MANKEEVAQFLSDFKIKMSIWRIIYRDDRGKNLQTLLELELTPSQRTTIVEEIQIIDYSEGPLEERLNGGPPMWIFGKEVKGAEVYIKISLGLPGTNVICISFHKSAYPMNYPLK